jgi:hypothetical protein
MKLFAVKDELTKCSNYIDVACMAIDNEQYFPNGATVACLLDDIYKCISSCIEELSDMGANPKDE